jgi:hypothetical protein
VKRIEELEELLRRAQLDIARGVEEKEAALLELAEATKKVCTCDRQSVVATSAVEGREAEREEQERLYIDKLEILENIGFHDVSRNLVVLSKCGGSMQRAIDELIRFDVKSKS